MLRAPSSSLFSREVENALACSVCGLGMCVRVCARAQPKSHGRLRPVLRQLFPFVGEGSFAWEKLCQWMGQERPKPRNHAIQP